MRPNGRTALWRRFSRTVKSKRVAEGFGKEAGPRIGVMTAIAQRVLSGQNPDSGVSAPDASLHRVSAPLAGDKPVRPLLAVLQVAIVVVAPLLAAAVLLDTKPTGMIGFLAIGLAGLFVLFRSIAAAHRRS